MSTFALAFVFITAFLVSAIADIAGQRYATTKKCSLGDFDGDLTPENLCQLVPKSGVDGNGRVKMRFGETDCVFNIKGCIHGRCYMIWDYSSLMPNDMDLSAVDRFEDLKVFISFVLSLPTTSN